MQTDCEAGRASLSASWAAKAAADLTSAFLAGRSRMKSSEAPELKSSEARETRISAAMESSDSNAPLENWDDEPARGIRLVHDECLTVMGVES